MRRRPRHPLDPGHCALTTAKAGLRDRLPALGLLADAVQHGCAAAASWKRAAAPRMRSLAAVARAHAGGAWQRAVQALAQYARRRGVTARDLDRVAARYRIAMWIAVALAALMALGIGWKAALWTLVFVLVAAAVAKTLWGVADLLEADESAW